MSDSNNTDLHRTALERPIDNVESSDDFLAGQSDCQEGIPHKMCQSHDYHRGYACQYQHDQNMDALTDGH